MVVIEVDSSSFVVVIGVVEEMKSSGVVVVGEEGVVVDGVVSESDGVEDEAEIVSASEVGVVASGVGVGNVVVAVSSTGGSTEGEGVVVAKIDVDKVDEADANAEESGSKLFDVGVVSILFDVAEEDIVAGDEGVKVDVKVKVGDEEVGTGDEGETRDETGAEIVEEV